MHAVALEMCLRCTPWHWKCVSDARRGVGNVSQMHAVALETHKDMYHSYSVNGVDQPVICLAINVSIEMCAFK
jgi:hypothetical protein